MPNPRIEISWGELVDRVSILELKKIHVTSDEQKMHLQEEISDLEMHFRSIDMSEIEAFQDNLKDINRQLWDVEDDLRLAEANQEFGEKFVALARSVYRLNDQRSAEKGKINDHLGSSLREIKVFSENS